MMPFMFAIVCGFFERKWICAGFFVLWKKSDGHQFKPILTKRTITSHLNWPHWTQKATTYDVGNLGPGLGPAQKMAVLNRLMGSQPSPLDYWISNDNTYINKRLKAYTYSLPFKKTTYFHNTQRQHKHGQYNSRVNEYSWLTDYYLGR